MVTSNALILGVFGRLVKAGIGYTASITKYAFGMYFH
jgi:hypothetical protein